MKNIILILFLLPAFNANAQVGNKDTVKTNDFTNIDTVRHSHSKKWSYIIPAGLVGYGFASLAINPIRHIDYYIAGRIKTSAPDFNSKVDDYMQVAPIAMVYILNLAGDYGKDRFVDRTALLVLSGGILTVADGLKFVAHRSRPYSNDKLSFPSGHTGAAFLAAQYLAEEYGDKSPIYAIAGYTVAAGTGIYRLYNREHWFSDVVAGAGLGILSTKAAYLAYPYIRHIFTHKDKYGRSSMIMPTYQGGAPGLSFAMQL